MVSGQPFRKQACGRGGSVTSHGRTLKPPQPPIVLGVCVSHITGYIDATERPLTRSVIGYPVPLLWTNRKPATLDQLQFPHHGTSDWPINAETVRSLYRFPLYSRTPGGSIVCHYDVNLRQLA